MKQYMVIEKFRPGYLEKVYDRFNRKGRLLPEGLFYLNSWLTKDGSKCFQLMLTSDPSLFFQWIGHWEELVEFEIIELADKRHASGGE